MLISFDRDGEHAYLADFGLTKPASTAEEARESIQLSGTTDYVSPEQISDGTAEPRSDVYALGALFYESLTGEVPYPHPSHLHVLFAHVNDPPPKPTEVKPELPGEIDEVIAIAMAKEPEDRYGTGAELARAAAAAFPEARRPRWQIATLAGVVAVAIAAAVLVPTLLLTGGGGAEATVPVVIEANSVARIDPSSNEVIASVGLSGEPAGVLVLPAVALSEDAVWVAKSVPGRPDLGDQTVSRIDLETNQLTQTLAIGHQTTALADGEGAVWVVGTAQGDGMLSEIDLQNVSVRRSLALELSDPVALAVGEGAVWIAVRDLSGHAVLRVDPQTGEVIATIPIPPIEVTDPVSGATILSSNEPIDITVGPGAVWLTSSQGGARPEELGGPSHTVVSRIDHATNQVITTIELEDAFSVGVDGSGDVWVTGPDQAVSRIDPTTNEVAATFSVPNTTGRPPPSLVRVAGDDVWIGGDQLTRVDANREEVVAVVDLSRRIAGLAASEGSVWVTLF